ncbi:ferredoxin-thioredoxin reductase catalytic chain [Nannochloropsis oceanica]
MPSWASSVLFLAAAAAVTSTTRAFMPPATPGTPAPNSSPREPAAAKETNKAPALVAPADLVRLQAEPQRAGGAAPAAGPDPAVTLKAMQKFAEKYCEISDTYFCSDLEIAATVVKGLAKHKDELGAPLCPCRHYEDKAAEVQMAYWNCPCVPMRERKECHCMLFLTPDTPFVGTEQKLPDEMLKDEGLGLK